jgi:DNA-binding NarL/FixJ family response regulator
VPPPESIPVVLLHRHGVVREALQHRLDAEPGVSVVAAVATADDAVHALADSPGALVVMSAEPSTDGCGAIGRLRDAATDLPIVLLVDPAPDGASDLPIVVESIKAGVAGIVRGATSGTVLVDTVRAVAHGAAVLDVDALRSLAAAWGDAPRNPLSMREREVLVCLAAGLTNAEVATRLYVSRETVKTHVAHVLRKLEVDDRSAAVDKAVRLGLLPSSGGRPAGPATTTRHHLPQPLTAHPQLTVPRRTPCEF